MKKIKYLIFLLPLLFITNVNAECTNYVNLDNLHSSTDLSRFEKLSSSSFNIYTSKNNNSAKQLSFSKLTRNTSYILSFDISYIDTSVFTTDYNLNNQQRFLSIYEEDTSNPFINYQHLNGEPDSSTRHFKIKFTSHYNIYDYFTISFNSRYIAEVNHIGLTIENFYLYEESEYDSCINGGSTPTPTTYTYTFKVDNEVYETDTVEEGTNIRLPETNPTKEGYTFTGWTLNGESYTGGEIHSNIEIIANFTENQVEPSPEPETPLETPEIDVSGLIPYLLLIASLVMLFIEINFIKSLLKSRR